ncbi:PDZ domain-containing protein [Hazenella sp. IB182357]|uniref:endopeptidase La n=1 Tax=Polycladospora coralii TaxID=2771432 RepID=A0A926NDE5_9BACL|nr:SepM family pheromone-processing serine protease [Polycladospora coralii]MBD1371403.1 PDZ domain-containing protein [Polycladospora coralii]MBS7530371.1 PDZ domain-containing protein [Polycladospora coralii]
MHLKKWNKSIIGWLSLSILLLGLGIFSIFPIPYFVIQPGEAVTAAQIVDVKQSKTASSGEFLLTTISMREAKMFDYLHTYLFPHTELVDQTEVLARYESEAEYEKRQETNMKNSQNKAVLAAFQQANLPISSEMTGIEVVGLVDDSQRGDELRVGDILLAINGVKLQSVSHLLEILKPLAVGEQVVVNLQRGQELMKEPVRLIALPTDDGKDKARAGLGILPMEMLTVKSEPQVEINAENIGGPSAGLMFALEILDQLSPEDLTQGMKIAGTGTISENGEVGQIGGIEHKIIAANREKAQIFFCPKDRSPEDSNEKVVKQIADELNIKVKIVPVRTLSEAIAYLQDIASG